MKTRKDKLSFLKGLLKKERSIVELREPQCPTLIGFKTEPGIYKEVKTGKTWTEKDVEEHNRKFPQDKTWTLLFENRDNEIEKNITELLNGK